MVKKKPKGYIISVQKDILLKFLVVMVSTLIIILAILLSKYQGFVLNSNYNKPIPTISFPFSTPLDSPTPTVIPLQKSTYTEPTALPTSDPDPIISCNISPNCGGGTKLMKQSECTSSICCQIGNNWSIFPSIGSCNQAQNNYNTGVCT